MKHKGFTVVEMIIVVVVIAILALITLVAYGSVRSKANDTVAKVDLAFNSKKMSLNSIVNTVPTGVQQSGTQLANSEYKVRISKRSSYKFYGYCTGVDVWGGPVTEMIQTAGTVDGHQYVYSTEDGNIRDVTSQMGTSSTGHPYKCGDFLKAGRIVEEFRDMIHYDGSVETGFVDIVNP